MAPTTNTDVKVRAKVAAARATARRRTHQTRKRPRRPASNGELSEWLKEP
jgi:hypothetical protein